MMEKPSSYMIVGMTTGEFAELSEEDGLTLKSIVTKERPARPEGGSRPSWLDYKDIYGAEISLRTDSICYFVLETEEARANFLECNPD